MSPARYFLPEHPTLTEVYSKAELRGMLQAGELSRSDMVMDDETGIAYLLGDLLAMPFPDAAVAPTRSTSPLRAPRVPQSHEFRADTPLPRSEWEGNRRNQSTKEPIEEDVHAYEAPPPGGFGFDETEEDEDEERDAVFEEEEDGDSIISIAGAPPSQHPHVALSPDEEDGNAGGTPPAAGFMMEDDLGEEEEFLYIGHPSWFAFPKSLLVVAICLGSAYYFYKHQVGLEWLTLPGSIAGLVLLFIGLDRTSTTYYVTTKRVEMEYGIVGRNTKEVRICDIRAIDVEQAGFGAFVGLGTVKFDSSATAGPEVCFRNVRRPHDIKQLVRELQG